MSTRATKEALFDGFAQVARALPKGRRAEIVDVLANGERSVESLADEVHQSIANTSQHLQILKNAGLGTPRRHRTFVSYRLPSPPRPTAGFASPRPPPPGGVKGAVGGGSNEPCILEDLKMLTRVGDRLM